MKKLVIHIFLILHAYACLAQGEEKISYYYKGEKIYLPVSYDRVLIEVKKGRPVTQVKKSIAHLMGVTEDSIEGSDLSNLVMVKLRRNTQGSHARTSLSKLDALPEVLFSRPVFKSASGKYSSYGKQFIVNLRKGISFSEVQKLMDATGSVLVRKYPFQEDIYILSAGIKSGYDGLLMANHFFESGLFDYAEPEMYVYDAMDEVPNDPLYNYQWAHKNTGSDVQYRGTPGADMKIQQAWDLTKGSPAIKIGLLDDGVDLTHPDLQDNLLQGFNGATLTSNPGDGGPLTSSNAHGTNCAGIIAAVANNGIGVAGVAPNCKIIPAVIYNGNASLGTVAQAAGFDYVRLQGADIISNSWGGGSPSSIIDDAINRAVTLGRNGKGCIVFASSGNNNAAVHYPAAYPQVIAVGGLSMCNQRKSPTSCDGETNWGANYGPGLAVVAPATRITTTDLQGEFGYNKNAGVSGNYYTRFTGTSSSCPNAAGVMALMLSFNPQLTAADAKRYLFLSCTKIPGYTYSQDPANPGQQYGTWNNETGYGSVNAYDALKLLADCSTPVVNTPTIVQPGCLAPFAGSVTIHATGTGTLEFSIDGGGNFQPSPIFDNVQPGSYHIVVRTRGSAPGCYVSYTGNPVVIKKPNTMVSTIIYTGYPVSIPDNNVIGVNIPLSVIGAGTVLDDLNFRLDAGTTGVCNSTPGDTNASVSHNYNGDLTFKLISPAGTSATLINKKGGSGQNFCLVTLDDEISFGTEYISNSGAVKGNFKPANALNIFDGEDPNGTWILNLSDNKAGDTGTFRRFSLVITTSTPCETLSTWYADEDGDGYSTGSSLVQSNRPPGYKLPAELTSTSGDCNDANAAIHPAATEICDNGMDDNCNGAIDEGCLIIWYQDRDNDGYGNAGVSKVSVTKIVGFVNRAGDCRDTDPSVYPGAPELCDGKDNDCNGLVDNGAPGTRTWYRDADGDGRGNPASFRVACSKPEGFTDNPNDCNDRDNTIYIGAPELCDGKDNNCNGLVDDGLPETQVWFQDADGDGFGGTRRTKTSCPQPIGYVANNRDCRENDATIYPGAPELCDGKDNDCNGLKDDGAPGTRTWYRDADGDRRGNAASAKVACAQPTGYVDNTNDCNDKDATIYTGAPELCDGKDNNCNGTKDEGCGLIVASVPTTSRLSNKTIAKPQTTVLQVRLWPNPARTEIMVVLDSFAPDQKVEIVLMNAAGRLLKAESLVPRVKGQQVRFDVGSFASGFYLLHIKHGVLMETKKVVIVR